MAFFGECGRRRVRSSLSPLEAEVGVAPVAGIADMTSLLLGVQAVTTVLVEAGRGWLPAFVGLVALAVGGWHPVGYLKESRQTIWLGKDTWDCMVAVNGCVSAVCASH